MIVLLLLLARATAVEWQVLVLCTQPLDQRARLEHWCAELNRRAAGHAPPYFALVETHAPALLLLYGWRPPVRGLMAADFPRLPTVLREVVRDGKRPFAQAHWVTQAWLLERLQRETAP